jgi:hypothetical protein
MLFSGLGLGFIFFIAGYVWLFLALLGFACQIWYLWFLDAWLRVGFVNLDIDSRTNMFIYSIPSGSTHHK